MPPGDCEILRPFCCPADGAAMGAAAPGRGIWKGSKEGEAGRAAGRRGQGFGTPCVRGLRHSLHARPPRPCRDIRALRESLSPLSLRESLSPCPLRPAALPASPSLLPFQIPRPGAAAPMAARGSLICVRSGFCSQIRDSQRFVTIFNA